MSDISNPRECDSWIQAWEKYSCSPQRRLFHFRDAQKIMTRILRSAEKTGRLPTHMTTEGLREALCLLDEAIKRQDALT